MKGNIYSDDKIGSSLEQLVGGGYYNFSMGLTAQGYIGIFHYPTKFNDDFYAHATPGWNLTA